MKKLFSFALSLALLLACAPALAENAAGTLTVAGTATVTVAADYATLEVGAETTAATVAAAQAENAAVMEAVLAALRAQGVADADIITSSFSVNAQYHYDYETGAQTLTGYAVSNMLSVTVRELSAVGTVLDAAMNAGANRTYGITFLSSKATDAYNKALERAVEDAAAKAAVLTRAAGKTLGALTAIAAAESYYGLYGASNAVAYARDEAAAGSAIVSGDISVTANVTLTYAFE